MWREDDNDGKSEGESLGERVSGIEVIRDKH